MLHLNDLTYRIDGKLLLDGALIARILCELEDVLNQDIVRELTGITRAAA